jgi:hypothetical protein
MIFLVTHYILTPLFFEMRFPNRPWVHRGYINLRSWHCPGQTEVTNSNMAEFVH